MDIQSKDLAPRGALEIEWAEHAMPVLLSIRERFAAQRPLEGIRIAACLHVTAETGVLARTLVAGGAQLRLCASNPLSTQDSVAAALAVGDGIEVYAIEGEDRATYFDHLAQALALEPHVVMDDGADLATLAHTDLASLAADVRGGTEETTSGVTRLRSMARDGVLRYPVFAVNDARTKHMFDNRYGTGQSTIDGILRATNRLLAGSCFVVCGSGWCGRGLAARAAGMGARVVVTEVDPIRALEAAMDGFAVLPIADAVGQADFICTVSGNKHVIRREHFDGMKSGVVVANAGHFDIEVDVEALAQLATARRELRPSLEEFSLEDGRTIHLLAAGRLVNLSAAEGHPADVMDMSFANQALAVEHIVTVDPGPKPGVYVVPPALDGTIAALKLAAMGIGIDTLTAEQERYLAGWQDGT